MCPYTVWIISLFIATLLLFGVLVSRRKFLIKETFEDAPPPDLNKMLGRVQGLLDKIATPEVLAHMTSVINKDPGELARLYAEQQKKM